MTASSHEPTWPVDINGWRIPLPPRPYEVAILWSSAGRVYEVALAWPARAGVVRGRATGDTSYVGQRGRQALVDEAGIPVGPLRDDIRVLDATAFQIGGQIGRRERLVRAVISEPHVMEDIVFDDGPLGLSFEAIAAEPADAEDAYSLFIAWTETISQTPNRARL